MKLNEEQITWLNKCTRSVLTDLEGYYESGGTWSLNSETGLVDVDGSFVCSDQGLKDFKGVRFGVVTGGFDCMWNSLTTLEGAPQGVGGDFYCENNSLTSLEGAPKEVERNLYCENNPVPEYVSNTIWSIMKDKKVPYLIALGIFKKEIDLLFKNITEETLKGASLLARNLS